MLCKLSLRHGFGDINLLLEKNILGVDLVHEFVYRLYANGRKHLW